MNLMEKVAFLKGLVEGSELTLGAKEQKVFDSLLEIVSDLASVVTDIDDDVSQLYDDVEELYEEVETLSDDLDELYEACGEGCDCGEHGHDHDDFMYEIKCEKCGETICIDEDTLLGGDVECPNCGEPIEIELDCECDDEDCDCGHEHN